MLANNDIETCFFGRLFGVADKADFGVAVNAPRNVCVIDWHRIFSEHVANGEHSFSETNVSERWRSDEIAFGIACERAADTFTITATGTGNMAGFNYTIDQDNVMASDTTWGDSETCWVKSKGGGC